MVSGVRRKCLRDCLGEAQLLPVLLNPAAQPCARPRLRGSSRQNAAKQVMRVGVSPRRTAGSPAPRSAPNVGGRPGVWIGFWFGLGPDGAWAALPAGTSLAKAIPIRSNTSSSHSTQQNCRSSLRRQRQGRSNQQLGEGRGASRRTRSPPQRLPPPPEAAAPLPFSWPSFASEPVSPGPQPLPPPASGPSGLRSGWRSAREAGRWQRAR